MDAQPEMPESDLFCQSLIQAYVNTPRFVERGWLVDRLADKLAVDHCRFLILTAQPGAGKTAFCAWLASHHPEWPRYFIRRDQRTPFGDAGARSFLLQIGFQLAAIYPDVFRHGELRVTIEQRVAANRTGGEVIGAEVDRLLASPFYQKAVEIRQQVDSNEGRLTGLRVGEWVTEPRLLPLSDLQYMALIDPATVLLKRSPGTRLVILVDALDELRYRDTSQSLLHWLAACPPLPANVRVVLTARPDEALLAQLRGAQGHWLQELVMEQHNTKVHGDLQDYANRLASEPGLRAALEAAGREPDEFVRQLIARAGSNLGYLDSVGRAMDQAVAQSDREGLQAILDLSHLPKTLEGLYAFFMLRIRNQAGQQSVELEDPETSPRHFAPTWQSVYRPILGVLSVAREPLTLPQIQQLGTVAGEWGYLAGAMNQLRQFLDRAGDAYRLYHATLAEFLVAGTTQQNPETTDLYLEPAVYHRRIVHACTGRTSDWGSLDWSHVDAYGVRNLVAHAAAAGELHGIHAIYGRGYLERKREVEGSEIPLLEEAVEVVLPHAGADEVLGVAYNLLYELRPNSYRAVRTLAAAAEKTRDLPDLRRRLKDSTLPLAEILLLLSEEQPPSVQEWRELKTRVDADKSRKAKERGRDLALLLLAWGLSGQADLQADLLASYLLYTQPDKARPPAEHPRAWYAAEGLRELGAGRVSQQTVQTLEDQLAAPVDLARSTALYILSRWDRRTPAVAQAVRFGLKSKRSPRLAAQAADAARLLRGLLPDDQAVSGLISILSRGAEKGRLVVYREKDPWNYARRRALRALGDYCPADASLLNKLQEARAQLVGAPAHDSDAPGIARLLEAAVRRIQESIAAHNQGAQPSR